MPGDRIKEDVQDSGLGDLIRRDSTVTSCAIRMHEMNHRSLFRQMASVGQALIRRGAEPGSLRIRLAP